MRFTFTNKAGLIYPWCRTCANISYGRWSYSYYLIARILSIHWKFIPSIRKNGFPYPISPIFCPLSQRFSAIEKADGRVSEIALISFNTGFREWLATIVFLYFCGGFDKFMGDRCLYGEAGFICLLRSYFSHFLEIVILSDNYVPSFTTQIPIINLKIRRQSPAITKMLQPHFATVMGLIDKPFYLCFSISTLKQCR